MTIAFGNKTHSLTNFPPGASLSFWHTVAAGDDRLLVVALQFRSDAAQTVSSVTYGGTGNVLTRIGTGAVYAGQVRTELYYLKQPPVGEAQISVTFSASTYAAGEASSWTGVHQTTSIGAAFTNTGSTTTPTVDVTSGATDEFVVDSVGKWRSTASTTLTPAKTLIYNAYNIYLVAGSSYSAGAATVTMSWTMATDPWAIIAVALKPATGSGSSASATVTIAEVRVTPLRAAPSGFSPTSDTAENNQAGFEASGQFPKVLVAKPSYGEGAAYIFDDVYTLPTVSPGGRIAVTNIPTHNSPNGSLLVVSQDALISYPLPFNEEPSLVHAPALATFGGSDFGPTFYPSSVDLGEPHKLNYVDIDFQDGTANVDSVAYAYRWDATNGWSEIARSKDSGSCRIPAPLGFNAGRVLHLAISIHDSVATDPVGPSIRTIIADVDPIEMPARTGQQPPRASPEAS